MTPTRNTSPCHAARMRLLPFYVSTHKCYHSVAGDTHKCLHRRLRPRKQERASRNLLKIFIFDVFNHNLLVRLNLQQLQDEAKERGRQNALPKRPSDVCEVAGHVNQRLGSERETLLLPKRAFVNTRSNDFLHLRHRSQIKPGPTHHQRCVATKNRGALARPTSLAHKEGTARGLLQF